MDERGQEALEDTAGIVGIIIKIFGKGWIDKYYDNIKLKKLDAFGYATYLKAAFAQAEESLKEIENKLPRNIENNSIIITLTEELENQNKIYDQTKLFLVFRPKDHPLVKFVQNSYANMLTSLDIEKKVISAFIKSYNHNIENRISLEFGKDYPAHLEDVENNWLREKEYMFLEKMKKLGRIGFSDSEILSYEVTYGDWQIVDNFRKNGDSEEGDLKPIRTLIDDYFQESSDHIQKILFIVTDFGKGKSVFLKRYASELATQYLSTGDGLFPVYFNLQNYGNPDYSRETKLGVLANYLEMKFGINVEDKYYKNKTFIFLVDSLDESGELSDSHINNVVESVKRIQRLDPSTCRNNRLLITSRPIDDGLQRQLTLHEPFEVEEEGKKVPYYISIYGFKKAQFNSWLSNAIKNLPNLEDIKLTGIAKELVDNIKINDKYDVYEILFSKNILSKAELRRPLFAYMLYKLISKNMVFSSAGKIGIYLSFLNFLTKEAKYKEDKDYKVDLLEEFRFRNILHATAALWAYRRQKGKQRTLKKVDLYQTLSVKTLSTKTAYQEYKKIKDLQFLSHSYFGEEGDHLHFQHQAFAEILVAEYYLKIFIKYALDNDQDIDEARVKLVLGEPTEQTVQFLMEMLILLKETVSSKNSPKILEKRKLLFPLMSSLATKKYSRYLYCNNLYYTWYSKTKVCNGKNEITNADLKKWPIDSGALSKLIDLCKKIIESPVTYYLAKADTKTALYDKEVISIARSVSNLSPDIDKWLALLVGNILYNNSSKKQYFSSLISEYKQLFEMIKSWNYVFKEPCPEWGLPLFMGINMAENEAFLDMSLVSFRGINFSSSSFVKLNAWGADFGNCIFVDCSFKNVEMRRSSLYGSIFKNIRRVEGEFNIGYCSIGNNISIPFPLAELFISGSYLNWGSVKCVLGAEFSRPGGNTYKMNVDLMFNTLEGIMHYALRTKKTTVPKIQKWFKNESRLVEARKYFNSKIENLKDGEL